MSPEQLLQHFDQGTLWPDGAGDAFPDLAGAYQAALAVRALRQARGERPCGYKVGFTNRSIWPRYQVFAPMWGTVWDTTLVQGQDHLALGRLCQPRLEPEVVFGFGRTPPPQAGLDELVAALDWLAPGFEVVHCHQPGWRFQPPHTVADGGLHGRLLIGPRQPLAQVAADAAGLHARLAQAQVQLLCNGTPVDQGLGAQVLGSPLLALQHFLAELRACPGAPDIQPGDVVTTGTWTDAWPVQAGQTWTARFSNDLLPPISLRFDAA